MLKPIEERSEETEAREAERWERPNGDALRGKGDGGDLALYRVCKHRCASGQVVEAQSHGTLRQRQRRHHLV